MELKTSETYYALRINGTKVKAVKNFDTRMAFSLYMREFRKDNASILRRRYPSWKAAHLGLDRLPAEMRQCTEVCEAFAVGF